jgi:uncharacterized damage-inducible protein DinB
MDLLDRLLGHDDWATRQLLDLSRGLTNAQLDQPLDVGHRTLRATFEHMIFNVEAWTGIIARPAFDPRREGNSLAELADRHEVSYETFANFSRLVRDEQRLSDTFVDHYGEHMTYGGAILHVILHNAEHRTEALHILERLGVPDLPEVDHGLWDHVSRGAQLA